MEFLEYASVFRKRWLILSLTVVLAVVSAATLTLLATPQYKATTRLFFAVPGGETVSDLAQGSSFTEKQMSSYSQVARSPLVLQPVIDELELQTDPAGLSDSIQAFSPPNTVILEITAFSTDPKEATAVANAVGESLVAAVATLSPPRTDGTPSVLATTLSSATTPDSPSSPRVARNLVVGLLLGTIVGAFAALSREALDTRIRSSRDVSSVTERALLGTIGYDAEADAHPIVMIERPNSQRAEAIRRLRTNLQFVGLANSSRSLLVTSAVADEGKTTTTVNLAISLADAGARVVLVDADLRRPSLGTMLGLDGAAGLTSVLIGRAPARDVTQPWLGGRIDVLTSGPIPPNPSELLGSPSMASAIEDLRLEYDFVLLDSPPLLPVTDAAVLSKWVDGTLLVVAAGRAHKAHLRSALDGLDAVGANILGIVLNKAEMRSERGYGSDYHSYVPSADKSSVQASRRRRSNSDSPGLSRRRPADLHEEDSSTVGSRSGSTTGAEAE